MGGGGVERRIETEGERVMNPINNVLRGIAV